MLVVNIASRNNPFYKGDVPFLLTGFTLFQCVGHPLMIRFYTNSSKRQQWWWLRLCFSCSRQLILSQQRMECLCPKRDFFSNFYRPFVNISLVLQLFFFPVEVRACSPVWQVRFLLFHQVPVAARFVSVWAGIANDSVLPYNLFSFFVQQSPLLTLCQVTMVCQGPWKGCFDRNS